MYLDLLLLAFIYTPGLIAAGIERYIGPAPASEFKFYMVRTHVYGFFSYSFAVLAVHFFIWPVFESISSIDISDGITVDIDQIGFLIAFTISIPIAIAIAIALSVIWSSILKLNWVSIYLARNERKRELRKFSAFDTFYSTNLLSPKRSIVWEFDEKIKYIGTILWLQEKGIYIEIIFEDLIVEDYNGNEISKCQNTYIRVPANKVRIDAVEEKIFEN